MQKLDYPDPCSVCDKWEQCKDEKIACSVFFDFVSGGIPRGIPHAPGKYFYNRVFHGKDDRRVTAPQSGRRLTFPQVRLIRNMVDDRYSLAEISDIFNISKTLVSQIHRRDVYRDVA